MNCIQKQQLVSFPKVRIWKPWFRHFNNHKEFRNEGTVHLFSLMALFSYANFRSNERMISGERYMEAPGQWICKLGSLPRILRVHSKRQALEQLDYYEKYGFLTYEWLDEENEIIRFSITNWKEHCTSLQYNYYSYKGSGFFFFPLPVGRMLLRIAHKTEGIVFSELDAINKEGDTLLKLILHDELTMEINRAALSPFHPPRIPTREYDAIETSLDRPVLLNYQCDLLMLSDIHPMPEGFRGSPIMLCFDYQTQVIQRIVGPAIEVRPLESRLDYG